jgi:CIC family chloride channel protein
VDTRADVVDAHACLVALGGGLLTGALAATFRIALAAAEGQHVRLVAALLAASPIGGWCAATALSAAVAGVAGWLVFRVAPETAGSGIPHVEARLADGQAMRWRRVVPVKFVGGVLSLGAGLSLGREGPTVQMGGAVTDALARWARCDAATVRALLAAGAGAGLAAAFDAPLAGFVFVVEELRQTASVRMVTTGLIATLAANLVLVATVGDAPAFAIGNPPTLPVSVLPFAALVGVLAGLLGVAFDHGLLAALEVADRVPAPRWATTAAAGALAGILTVVFVAVIGDGESVTQAILRNDVPSSGWLAAVVPLKLGLTIASYASGAPGGIFAPLLLMGAALGGLVGQMVAPLVSTVAARPALAMAGMTGLFTAVVRAPITGIVLIEEMTSGQEQLLELTVAALAAYIVATVLRDRPVYEALAARDARLAARTARRIAAGRKPV